MSEVEPLYCAEQIKVPAALPEILKAWTKQVIRDGVAQGDLNAWSADYFAKLAESHARKLATQVAEASAKEESKA